MEITEYNNDDIKYKYISEDVVKLIVSKYKGANEKNYVQNYTIRNASDKMLGFLFDYWKLQINLGPENKVLPYFVKVISVTNAAKAKKIKEFKSFEKELYFYEVIKRRIEIPGMKPWGASLVINIGNALIFEDMNARQYKLRDKFKRFDMAHTLEALKTLSRFHASSIIYEERKSKELGRRYSLNEDIHKKLEHSGYMRTNNGFILCSKAAFDAIKIFSEYTKEQIKTIESRWFNIWSSALDLSNPSTKYRSVICHRDLWNNNLMFHYKSVDDALVPDDCVLVDFPVAKYQPPSGDVMLLLYCNLDPKFREANMEKFLGFYLDELNLILVQNGLNANFIDREEFFESAEIQRQWAVVVCACLLPQFWIDDDLTTKIFCDTAQFEEVLSKNKSGFVTKMIQLNPDYKEKVMAVFEEIAERYCLN